MEISIRWNICRVCLQEENESDGNPEEGKMIQIFADGDNLTKKIFECSGILVKPNDSLPDKICHKCNSILKYAAHFRKTFLESNVYLQSVIEHTKSASTLFKQDRSAETTLDLQSDQNDIDYIDDNNDIVSYLKGDNSKEDKEEKSSSTKEHNKRRQDQKSIQKNKKIKQTGTSKSPYSYSVREPKSTENQIDIEDSIFVDQEDKQEEDEDTAEINDGVFQQSEHVENHEFKNIEDGSSNSNTPSLDEISLENSSENTKEINNINLQEPELNYPQIYESAKVSEEDEEVYGNDNTSLVKSAESNLMKNMKSEENGNTLYYILNKTNNTASSEHEEEGDYIVCDDNIEFLPLEEEEQDYLEEETKDGDDTDNQVQVTSTVVTKEEVDLDSSNSNSMDNSQVIDAEYVIDGFIVDANEPNAELKDSNISIRSKNIRTDRHGETAVERKKLKKQFPTYRASSTSSPGLALVCDICGNLFINRQRLNSHMKIHQQERTHQCEICYKRFITACNLQAHMRTHTGEKPFMCQFCSRRFTDRSTHLRHERIHTNEKPFPCEYCGKSFSLATTLQAHRKVHTGERPFNCDPCGKSFKLPHQLKAHKKTHLHRVVEQSVN